MALLSPTGLHRHVRRPVERLLDALVDDEETIHRPVATGAAGVGNVALSPCF